MKTTTCIMVLFLILISCISKEENIALKKIAELSQADETTISSSYSIDKQKGKQKNLELIVKTPKFIDTTYLYRRSSSMFAWILFTNLGEKSKNYDQFNVVLDFPNNKVSRYYRIKDLSMIDPFSKILEKIITNRDSIHNEYFRTFVDHKAVSDSILTDMINYMDKIDKEYGSKTDISLLGFHFDNVKETNEPITVMWIDTEYGNNVIDYNFIISNITKKIIHIGINETLIIQD